ncbi:MAG TPA: class I SAM-dependent RNA methyltransferase [Streptosporangiaceae bacterium]|jgi:tRNA/tmRNA/rRNA uracil-C5-methylase (TrmA/RlmC/RlmD family)
MRSVVDLLELEVGEAAQGGWCVAREPSGRVVLVRHALPGERVLAQVTETTARFARADAVQVLAASPDRVEPHCPHAHPGGCGGCDWQHASPQAQRRLKATVISQQLRRIAGLDREVTVEALPGDPAGLGWRTRVRFAVGRDGTAGLRKHRSHEVIDVGHCPIAHPLVDQAGVTTRPWPGADGVQVVSAPGSGQRAIVITPSGRPGRPGKPARQPGPRGREGRYAGWTGEGTDPVLVAKRGGGLAALRGGAFLQQAAAGRTWRVSAGVFWQVHPAAADVLTEAVQQTLQPRAGDVALDLYCGAGLFAGVLADAVGPSGTVIGIESDQAAVRDARHNLRAAPWARVHRGDVAEVLARADWAQARIAVLDPPRAGAGQAVLDQLLAPGTSLGRVGYVSCDPATLARDIGRFRQAGWQLAELRAFDAFPMTHHVECVATLTRG